MRGGPAFRTSATGMTVKPCVVDQVPVPPRQKRWKNRARCAGRVATAYGIRRKACAVGQDSEPPGTGRQEDHAQWQCFRDHREKRARKTVRGGPTFRTSVTGMTVKPCVVDQVPAPPRQERRKNRARCAGRVATAYGIRRKACAVGQDSEPPGTGNQEDRAQWQCFRDRREKRARKTVRGGPTFRTSVTGMTVKACEVGR